MQSSYRFALYLQHNQPWGLAFDNAGNLFIAGGGNYIRKMAPDRTIAAAVGNGTFADLGDGGPAINTQLTPGGLALDNNGNL
jgi:hypothetical protein